MERSGKHPIQKLMDNTWLLLALVVMIPIVSYTLWGIYEYITMQPATLP